MYIFLVFDQTGKLTNPETCRLKIQCCCLHCYHRRHQVAVHSTLQIDYLTVNQRGGFFNGSGPTLECCDVHHRVSVQFIPHSLCTVHGASSDRRHHPVHHGLSVNLICVAKGRRDLETHTNLVSRYKRMGTLDFLQVYLFDLYSFCRNTKKHSPRCRLSVLYAQKHEKKNLIS